MHDEFDDVAENASNDLAGLEREIDALSNNIAYDYVKTRDLKIETWRLVI